MARFPEGAARFYDAIFGVAHERLEAFLRERVKVPRKAAPAIASDLLARVLHPRFTRALFGLDVVTDEWLDDQRISAQLDLKPIRRAVADLLAELAR